MTEKELIELGFTKVIQPEEKIGNDIFVEEFYYYVYELGGRLDLLTNADDEVVDGEWKVFFYDVDNISFTQKHEMQLFIELMERNKTK